MAVRTVIRAGLLLTLAFSRPVTAHEVSTGPASLSLSDVVQRATEQRSEIEAARARTRAGEARPTIVSALEDPMFSPSLGNGDRSA